MKRLTLISLTATLLLLLNGCNPAVMISHQLDPKLPRLNNVKVVTGSTSVAFEWQPVAAKHLDGVNIYRTVKNGYVNSSQKELIKVATINSPFASHYVDTGLAQNSSYTYTFTTTKGAFESPHGQIIAVKTKPPFEAITFFHAFQKASNVIKLIWRPHPNKLVKMYKIEKSINGEKWKWIATVKNRMMSEYIDTYVAPGFNYKYRVIAVGYDDSLSKPSNVISIYAK